ncbi:MFS transporter [Acidiphilium sp. AL]|uniref:MFS transporter n=1 Tax=Acidiphilium iwatense TaxID=768198 RepID=A0ABS9E068_9PROT|nr:MULTISPECIES: MFS transporter [Acidiphilium]MCF3948407.1 MFS transporter [Acidiphilium iwatense]MCU4161156.1 MFS transporter [Acidiphilium sp. AL]
MSNEVTTIRSSRDIIDIINSHQFIKNTSFIIVLIALGGVFIDAYDFTSLGLGVVQLKKQMSLTAFETGLLTASMAGGALVGGVWGGYYSDKIGRLKMFMLDLIFFVIAALGAAFSTNLDLLIAFRVLMGLGVGLDFPVAMSFIAEYTSSDSKGTYLNLWQVAWYVAASAGFVVILPFYYAGVGNDLWRWAVGLGALPAAIILILRFIYMEESPMWAAQQGDLQEAARGLKKTYGIDVNVALELEEEPANLQKHSIKVFLKIIKPPYQMRTLLTSIICATQSMEYFAVGFYLPTISLLLFGEKFVYAILGGALFNVAGIVGGGIQSKITQRVGTRRLSIVGYCITLACLILMGITNGHVSAYFEAILMAVFIFGHSFGQGSQGQTMAALSYPTSIRGAGVGFVQAITRAGSIFGFFLFPLALAAFGINSAMLIIAVIPLLGLLGCLLIRWEPIGVDVDSEDYAPAVMSPRAMPR